MDKSAERQLTADEHLCEATRRADGQPCGKPAKYRLLPLRATEVARIICGKHARHYSTKWLERL